MVILKRRNYFFTLTYHILIPFYNKIIHTMKHLLLLFVLLIAVVACKNVAPVLTSNIETKRELPPNERYGDLFEAVQMNQVFPDGKTFVDATPKKVTDEIMKQYQDLRSDPNFNLDQFVNTYFDPPKNYSTGFKADISLPVEQHINLLWNVLTRQPDKADKGSLFPLPHPYIVPGGRFGEIYYWDSYFTMLGLQVDGKIEMIENMVKNFAYLIDKVGFIPNGNRTYFLSRSQPPFFSKMVHLLADSKGEQVIPTYLPQLEKEYQFWMSGLDKVNAKQVAEKKVVYLEDGIYLNRYWDRGDYPRAESYREDIETVSKSTRLPRAVYRDLRSACESGWDFSSRWFRDTENLTTIHTTEIIPVDLNSLLYDLEQLLASGYQLKGNTEQANTYGHLAKKRKAAILKYCWNEEVGFFMDYDFVAKKHTPVLSLAGLYPLESGIATPAQAQKVANLVEAKFLKAGGVVSTLNATGQQWDYPNGWAPLQWTTIAGLRNYQQDVLANTIKTRWVALNKKVYKNTGKLVEKYDVIDMSLEAGGGEYPVQDGFGWTNGVLLKLLKEK